MLFLAIIWWVAFINLGLGAMIVAFASACGEAVGEESIYPEPEDLE